MLEQNNAVPDQPLDVPYVIMTEEHTSRKYIVHMNGSITSPDEYIELIQLLYSATEFDVFEFYLNSPGGSIDSGIHIVDALASTKAHIKMNISSNVSSMAAIIAMMADEYEIGLFATMMFHNMQVMLGGHIPYNESVQTLDSHSQQYNKLLTKLTEGFLSESEVQDILEGKTIWLDSDSIVARLDAREAHLNSLTNESDEEDKADSQND